MTTPDPGGDGGLSVSVSSPQTWPGSGSSAGSFWEAADIVRSATPAFLGEVSADDLRVELISTVGAYGSQRKFAAAHGISAAIVSLTLAGKRAPDAAIANALGYVVRTTFHPMRTTNAG
jgi:hypothetical protein